jgi:pyruvate/2-oxoglutarate dehydrogenase complex dihydrolipoamide dehydrogenase (E3) component
MLAAAHAVHEARRLEPFGARLDGRVTVDFARIAARKDKHVERFKKAKVEAIEAAGYDVLDARGRLVDTGVIDAGGRRIRAGKVVIATGSVPACLPIPGVDEVPLLTSDDVMRLTEAPESLIVQGGGPIGLELSQFFARIGTRVLLVNRSPLLSKTDADCGAELRRAFEAESNLRLAVPGRIERLSRHDRGLRAVVHFAGGTVEESADALLMAVGRDAAYEGIGLEAVGLSTRDGRIPHDREMRTENPDVYVAGDVTGDDQILHLANEEGRVAGHNAAGAGPLEIDERLKICEIFTDPPFAQLGLTEQMARERRIDCVVGREYFAQTGRAITMGADYGLWKMIADRTTGEILGTSILGPRADDLVHIVSTLMRYRGGAADVLELPWYHPTLSEVLLNVARDVQRRRT